MQENRYDVENLRFELLENGNRTAFIYHNGELLHEEGGKEKQSSYHLGVGVDALQRGQETYYYHRDKQLSTAFITGTDGTVRNSYQYDAFGNLSDTIEQLPNRVRYTGQQYDELTGQYYLRARYYNPVLGRFMQEDTYQGDGLNLYAYCKNNPVAYYDPSGYSQQNPDPGCAEAKFGEDDGNDDSTGIKNGIGNTGISVENFSAKDVPGVKNGEFNKFFNSLSVDELDTLWSKTEIRDVIEARLRSPGGLHEWHLVSRTPQFKYWDISAEEIKSLRTLTNEVKFVNPNGIHGGRGSTTAHNELLKIVDTSEDYDMFVRRLNNWANYRLEGGLEALPEDLQIKQ